MSGRYCRSGIYNVEILTTQSFDNAAYPAGLADCENWFDTGKGSCQDSFIHISWSPALLSVEVYSTQNVIVLESETGKAWGVLAIDCAKPMAEPVIFFIKLKGHRTIAGVPGAVGAGKKYHPAHNWREFAPRAVKMISSV